jgi:hypothetical protein
MQPETYKSFDANDHFIALGSNVGVVFLYNRKDKELERLRTHVR